MTASFELLHTEMLRTRDRLHKLEGMQAAIVAYQRQTLHEMSELRTTCKDLGERYEGLARADEIAAAIHTRLLTWPIKIAVSLAAAVTFASGIKGLIF